MPYPNFILFGASKSGTTSLYKYLEQHPQVFMSAVKEPGFFSNLGRTPHIPPEQQNTTLSTYYSLDAYLKLFEGAEGRTAIGEASSFYYLYPQAAEAIKEHIPNVKLLAILREPIERAYSDFVHQRQLGKERQTEFAKVAGQEMNNEPIPRNYLVHSLYHKCLQPYFELFPREQIRIYLMEDLTSRPDWMFRDVFSFLGVDPAFLPDTSHRHNPTTVAKYEWIEELITTSNPIKNCLAPLIPRQSKLRDLVRKIRWRNRYKPGFDPRLRKQLVGYFREDVLQLQHLLQRDLSGWMRE